MKDSTIKSSSNSQSISTRIEILEELKGRITDAVILFLLYCPSFQLRIGLSRRGDIKKWGFCCTPLLLSMIWYGCHEGGGLALCLPLRPNHTSSLPHPSLCHNHTPCYFATLLNEASADIWKGLFMTNNRKIISFTSFWWHFWNVGQHHHTKLLW